jgi:hypothetical protein
MACSGHLRSAGKCSAAARRKALATYPYSADHANEWERGKYGNILDFSDYLAGFAPNLGL